MSGRITNSRNAGRARGRGIRPPTHLPEQGSATAPAARPVRNRKTAAALAAGLALSVVALCAVSTSARAQEAYVSNLARSHNAGELSVSRRWSQAIGFTTGSRSGGYTLSHLETIVTRVHGDGLLVSLYDEAAGGGPGTRQFDFTNPDEITANALVAFMAPADTTLTADTRYFVVYVETGVGGASVASTPQTSEDGGASPGWSIDDRRYYVSYDNDDGWKPVVDAGGGVPRFALNPPGATADTTAPALTTATVDGTSLVLTYDEALDENSVPAAAAYAVNVDGGGATAPASVAVGGSAVTLTLGTAIIGGQTVTVSYTVRSSNPVQDVPGNDAAALTGRPVTNLSNTPATGRPQISGTAQVGQTLTASTGGITDTDGRTKADGGEPGHAYTYQWVRVDGGTGTDIAGATNRTYRLIAADQGRKLKVKVGFTDDDGNAEEVESDAFPDTGTVLNAPREPLYLCGVEVGPAIGVVIGAHVDLCWETGDELPTGDDVEMEWRLKSFWGMDNPEPWNQWREFARGNAIDPCTPGSTTCVKFRVGRFPRGFPFTLQARIRRGGAELSPPLSATLEAAMPNTDTTALVPELSQPLDEATGHGIDSVTGPFVLELVFAEPVGNGFLGALGTEAVRGLDPGDFEATNATVDAVEIWDGGVYKVSVTPTDLGQPVTVELPAGTVKGVGEGISAAGTNNFTRDNVTSNRVSTASAPDLPGLSVNDASVEEGENASLKFEVTLDRKASETVTVDYATSNGSATAGLDYTQVSDTLIFAPGETKKTVSVTVLNDDINEESETLKLTLSNPSSGAYLARAEATGTITNSDPIPKAWIARFGRTVADQVLDAVDERLRAARSARAEVTLGGRRIGFGSAFGQEYGDGEGTVAPVAGPASPLVATTPDSAWLGATAHPDAEGTARLEALGSWLNGDATEGGLRQAGSRTMSGRELLAGSSFSLAAETDGGGGAALWGRMAHSGFSGREGTLALDGDVTTGLLGADYARERWTAGLVVSRSIGEGGFRGASSGYIEATMTAVTPWAGYAVSDRLSVWGAAGRGTGDLTVKPAGGAALSANLGMTLATAGARARLAGGDGPRLDAVADARWVRTTSARVTSSAGNLAPATAQVTRLRLGLDGSWPLALGGGVSGEAAPGEGAPGQGATLTPRLGLGLRHDGGDAETGYGVDISGGVDLAAPARGLAVSLDARGVLTHEAAGLRDRGIAGTLSWNPRRSGRGPKLTLKQSFGAGASGGRDALLARETLEGLAAGDDHDGRRLEAKLGYGLAMFGGRFTGTPEIGLGLSETGRDYALGWRLVRAGAGPESLELSLEARRREGVDDNTDSEHAAGFRLTARF